MQLHMCGHLCVSGYMCAYVSICGLCVTVSVTGYLYAFVIMCNCECLMGVCISLCMDLGVDMHSVTHFHGDYLPHHRIVTNSLISMRIHCMNVSQLNYSPDSDHLFLSNFIS